MDLDPRAIVRAVDQSNLYVIDPVALEGLENRTNLDLAKAIVDGVLSTSGGISGRTRIAFDKLEHFSSKFDDEFWRGLVRSEINVQILAIASTC